ncbi:MAG: HD domain-containing phosphohydrolase [Thermoguttaceae bacterium]
MSRRILCVDDDSNILVGYQRALRKQFAIETALGAEEALQSIARQGPYAVVVADMRMPGMNGVELLAEVRKIAPNTVRMMLTGNADQQTALEAVNQGQIFRFMTKPCPPEDFARTLEAGLEQYRLISAEKELLSKTLSGSIKMLSDVLTMVQPNAFGRASRVQRLVRELCKALNLSDAWQIPIAAMLSQVGCVAVAEEILRKVYAGQELLEHESEAYRAHPRAGQDLVANIPRMQDVAEIIGYQEKLYDGRGFPADFRSGDKIPLGSRILKVVLDWDALMSGGMKHEMALAEICSRKGWYDPAIVTALAQVLAITAAYSIQEVRISDLADGMILASDVRSNQGALLCAKGQELTHAMRLRLSNYCINVGVSGPVRVFIPIEIAAYCPEPHSATTTG